MPLIGAWASAVSDRTNIPIAETATMASRTKLSNRRTNTPCDRGPGLERAPRKVSLRNSIAMANVLPISMRP
jgi:hypothetical protein